jgi:hypothetical protein
MKFKPIALVVIGILLASTITLTFTRPSTSTAEILACTNKSTGKTRLTISGKCNIKSESQSPVTDLWGLQPTSSTSTQPKSLKKHVVDASGKDLGELISNDGLQNFWITTNGGLFNISTGGYVYGESGAWDPVFYSDKSCQIPYFGVEQDVQYSSRTRAVVEVPKLGPPSNQLIRRAYRPVGRPQPSPKLVYFYVTPRTSKLVQQATNPDYINKYGWQATPGCLRVELEKLRNMSEAGVPKKVLKSSPVDLPTYRSPLTIVEK